MSWKRLRSIVAPIADMMTSRRSHNKPAASDSSAAEDRQTGHSASGLNSWGKQLIVGQPHAACRQARKLDRKYFALGGAPHLPLEGCNSGRCQCWYKILSELRSGQDRRLGLERRMMQRVKAKSDRRNHTDRRNSSRHDLRHTA
jgi:hypothetical protein